MSSAQFERFLHDQRIKIDKLLIQHLSIITQDIPREFARAIRYVTLGKGKRLRALLVYAVGKAYGIPLKLLAAPAIAIEMIHAFSLVHDDLPAMDDDDLRRGKPTCHVAFDEATAILVGDALAVGAFQVLSEDKKIPAEKKIMMIKALAEASGSSGMAGGQYLDLHPPKKVSKNSLEKMYRLKTGALISAAIKLGAIAADVNNKKELQFLEKIGLNIGLAFQIKDDILNIEGSAKKLGKNVGTDQAKDKITYPALVGMPKAKAKIALLKKDTDAVLKKLKINSGVLKELVDYILCA